MLLKKSTLVWTFIWSLFMGVTAISIGVGALFPPLNYISGPFVCPGGALSTDQQMYHTAPGTTVTTITWYCTNGSTGTRTELSIWPMSLASGLIYGLLLFLVIFAVMWIRARRPVGRSATRYAAEESGVRFASDLLTPAAQIEELMRLRHANQISEVEFLKRQRVIMSKMPR